ncbi:MAG: amino acid ABC transporter substrate-binding protein [Eubacteriaceae bacterium]|nr:amino acid ABC transporter substrate-binding protein [Eubacteriaceae bacterium]
MKKFYLGFAALLLVMFLLAGCSSAKSDKWSEIEERGTIIVGLDDTFVPMGFRDSNGDLTGFDVELAKEAVKRIGLEVKFQPINWDLKETELSTGNIDLIWNGYTMTDERKEKVNFTKPYLDNQQVIVVLSGSAVKTKTDLKGKAVATQTGSSSYDAIVAEGADADFKDGEIVLFETYNDAFMDLEAGRVDAVVADEILARYYIAERGVEKYTVLAENFGQEEYGVGVRLEDKTLLDKLNTVLDEMKADGTAAEISKKWFGENIVK